MAEENKFVVKVDDKFLEKVEKRAEEILSKNKNLSLEDAVGLINLKRMQESGMSFNNFQTIQMFSPEFGVYTGKKSFVQAGEMLEYINEGYAAAFTANSQFISVPLLPFMKGKRDMFSSPKEIPLDIYKSYTSAGMSSNNFFIDLKGIRYKPDPFGGNEEEFIKGVRQLQEGISLKSIVTPYYFYDPVAKRYANIDRMFAAGDSASKRMVISSGNKIYLGTNSKDAKNIQLKLTGYTHIDRGGNLKQISVEEFLKNKDLQESSMPVFNVHAELNAGDNIIEDMVIDTRKLYEEDMEIRKMLSEIYSNNLNSQDFNTKTSEALFDELYSKSSRLPSALFAESINKNLETKSGIESTDLFLDIETTHEIGKRYITQLGIAKGQENSEIYYTKFSFGESDLKARIALNTKMGVREIDMAGRRSIEILRDDLIGSDILETPQDAEGLIKKAKKIIGYNIEKFDIPELQKAGVNIGDNLEIVDLYKFVKENKSVVESYLGVSFKDNLTLKNVFETLESAGKTNKIAAGAAHSAGFDVLMTREVYSAVLPLIDAQKSNETFASIQKARIFSMEEMLKRIVRSNIGLFDGGEAEKYFEKNYNTLEEIKEDFIKVMSVGGKGTNNIRSKLISDPYNTTGRTVVSIAAEISEEDVFSFRVNASNINQAQDIIKYLRKNNMLENRVRYKDITGKMIIEDDGMALFRSDSAIQISDITDVSFGDKSRFEEKLYAIKKLKGIFSSLGYDKRHKPYKQEIADQRISKIVKDLFGKNYSEDEITEINKTIHLIAGANSEQMKAMASNKSFDGVYNKLFSAVIRDVAVVEEPSAIFVKDSPYNIEGTEKVADQIRMIYEDIIEKNVKKTYKKMSPLSGLRRVRAGTLSINDKTYAVVSDYIREGRAGKNNLKEMVDDILGALPKNASGEKLKQAEELRRQVALLLTSSAEYKKFEEEVVEGKDLVSEKHSDFVDKIIERAKQRLTYGIAQEPKQTKKTYQQSLLDSFGQRKTIKTLVVDGQIKYIEKTELVATDETYKIINEFLESVEVADDDAITELTDDNSIFYDLGLEDKGNLNIKRKSAESDASYKSKIYEIDGKKYVRVLQEHEIDDNGKKRQLKIEEIHMFKSSEEKANKLKSEIDSLKKEIDESNLEELIAGKKSLEESLEPINKKIYEMSAEETAINKYNDLIKERDVIKGVIKGLEKDIDDPYKKKLERLIESIDKKIYEMSSEGTAIHEFNDLIKKRDAIKKELDRFSYQIEPINEKKKTLEKLEKELKDDIENKNVQTETIKLNEGTQQFIRIKRKMDKIDKEKPPQKDIKEETEKMKSQLKEEARMNAETDRGTKVFEGDADDIAKEGQRKTIEKTVTYVPNKAYIIDDADIAGYESLKISETMTKNPQYNATTLYNNYKKFFDAELTLEANKQAKYNAVSVEKAAHDIMSTEYKKMNVAHKAWEDVRIYVLERQGHSILDSTDAKNIFSLIQAKEIIQRKDAIEEAEFYTKETIDIPPEVKSQIAKRKTLEKELQESKEKLVGLKNATTANKRRSKIAERNKIKYLKQEIQKIDVLASEYSEKQKNYYINLDYKTQEIFEKLTGSEKEELIKMTGINEEIFSKKSGDIGINEIAERVRIFSEAYERMSGEALGEGHSENFVNAYNHLMHRFRFMSGAGLGIDQNDFIDYLNTAVEYRQAGTESVESINANNESFNDFQGKGYIPLADKIEADGSTPEGILFRRIDEESVALAKMYAGVNSIEYNAKTIDWSLNEETLKNIRVGMKIHLKDGQTFDVVEMVRGQPILEREGKRYTLQQGIESIDYQMVRELAEYQRNDLSDFDISKVRKLDGIFTEIGLGEDGVKGFNISKFADRYKYAARELMDFMNRPDFEMTQEDFSEFLVLYKESLGTISNDSLRYEVAEHIFKNREKIFELMKEDPDIFKTYVSKVAVAMPDDSMMVRRNMLNLLQNENAQLPKYIENQLGTSLDVVRTLKDRVKKDVFMSYYYSSFDKSVDVKALTKENISDMISKESVLYKFSQEQKMSLGGALEALVAREKNLIDFAESLGDNYHRFSGIIRAHAKVGTDKSREIAMNAIKLFKANESYDVELINRIAINAIENQDAILSLNKGDLINLTMLSVGQNEEAIKLAKWYESSIAGQSSQEYLSNVYRIKMLNNEGKGNWEKEKIDLQDVVRNKKVLEAAAAEMKLDTEQSKEFVGYYYSLTDSSGARSIDSSDFALNKIEKVKRIYSEDMKFINLVKSIEGVDVSTVQKMLRSYNRGSINKNVFNAYVDYISQNIKDLNKNNIEYLTSLVYGFGETDDIMKRRIDMIFEGAEEIKPEKAKDALQRIFAVSQIVSKREYNPKQPFQKLAYELSGQDNVNEILSPLEKLGVNIERLKEILGVEGLSAEKIFKETAKTQEEAVKKLPMLGKGFMKSLPALGITGAFIGLFVAIGAKARAEAKKVEEEMRNTQMVNTLSSVNLIANGMRYSPSEPEISATMSVNGQEDMDASSSLMASLGIRNGYTTYRS